MTATNLRIMAGILAVIALAVVGYRLYGISALDAAAGDRLYGLRLLFPLSLAMFFGYLAWKGKLPFSNESDKSSDSKK